VYAAETYQPDVPRGASLAREGPSWLRVCVGVPLWHGASGQEGGKRGEAESSSSRRLVPGGIGYSRSVELTRGLTLLVVLLAATVAAIAPATAIASFAGRNGVIAYPTNHGLWALEPRSGDQTQLTFARNDSYPSFSPSGDELAFQRGRGRTEMIYLAHADGSQPTPLVWGAQPAFSPSGREIVFVRPTGLLVVSLNTGAKPHQILRDPGARTPRWGPRGLIAFERTNIWRVHHDKHVGTGREVEVDVLSPRSGEITRLMTIEEDVNLWPEWSPGGDTLVVSLCEAEESANTRERIGAGVELQLVGACGPTAWAPAGNRRVQADIGNLGGREESTCPSPESVGEGPVAWQPLQASTMRVATAPCQIVKPPPSELPAGAQTETTPTTTPTLGKGAEPSKEAMRVTKVCFVARGRHRCVTL
jgi:hypothetical protein